MSDNNNISQVMIDKLARRQDYMAWYLLQYKMNEKLNDEELAAFLKTSKDKVDTLALCKVPNSKSIDFMQRIATIADFTNINSFKLSVIIRKVESILVLQNSNIRLDNSLMAARERENKKKNNDKK